MPTTATTYRYYLPRKSTKGDCPQCSPKHRRTLSRYIDRQTGEALPDEYGRCDRESNCTYHVSPYHKGQSGMSYADEVYENWKTANPLPLNYTRRPMSKPPCPVAEERIHSLPAEVFQQSLGHYNQNQFASLLRGHFGQARANDLLKQFQIGTCHRPNDLWPETTATVFWIIDTEGRVRGGQVNQFATDWHRAKFKSDNESKERSCISSAGHALLKRYERNGEAAPGWLIDYQDNAEKWPIAFGLHQLRTAPIDMPFAFVEACKTAVICAGYFPEFVWGAFGGKSYPKPERLAGLEGRRIMLYPDLNAFDDWSKRAEVMRSAGYQVSVSSLLEDHATDQQRQKGLDLADFLLQPHQPQRPKIVNTFAD